MKELVVLRHAKSSWQQAVEDRHRPLTPKGIERIKAVSEISKTIFLSAERIYSSPAIRALHTTVTLMDTLEIPLDKLTVVEDLYTFDSMDFIAFIRSLNDTENKVLLVGHNPAITETVNSLGDQFCDNLPTAAWSSLRFTQNQWATVNKGVTTFGFPKQLMNNE